MKPFSKPSLSNRHSTSWFNNECKIPIQLQKAAIRKFNKELTTSNLKSFKVLRAKERKTFKQAKKKKSVGKIMWTNLIPPPNQPQSGK